MTGDKRDQQADTLRLGRREDPKYRRSPRRRSRSPGRSPPRQKRSRSPRRSPPRRRRSRSPRQETPNAKQEPWEVVIGDAADRAHISETATEISAGRVTLKKADLAALIGCGVNDKCWAVAMSRKPWPKKLTCCNHKGKKGHEYYDSAHHVFTAQQMAQVTDLKKKLEQKARRPE
jgi:hypothetical protein